MRSGLTPAEAPISSVFYVTGAWGRPAPQTDQSRFPVSSLSASRPTPSELEFVLGTESLLCPPSPQRESANQIGPKAAIANMNRRNQSRRLVLTVQSRGRRSVIAVLLRGSGGLKYLLVIVTSTSSFLRRDQTPIPCVLLSENDRSLESFSHHLKALTRQGWPHASLMSGVRNTRLGHRLPEDRDLAETRRNVTRR